MRITGYGIHDTASRAVLNSNKSIMPKSFGAVKKSHLTGLTLACACIFKAPLEKFHSEYDLSNWAEENLQLLFENAEVLDNLPQRAQRMQQWRNYFRGNDGYILPPPAALVIFNSIIKDLRPDNKKLPPPVNVDVINKTILEIEKAITEDNKYTFNFCKQYQKNLNLYFLKSSYSELDNENTGWVFIPSQSHDLEHFEDNINKLMLFSYKTWCTKSFNAPFYLAGGDFHIYMEKGNPKAVIRMYNDYIIEIQGEKNDKTIPCRYLKVIENRINSKHLTVTPKIQDLLKEAYLLDTRLAQIKKDLAQAIENNDIIQIFSYFNMQCEKENICSYLLKKIMAFFSGKSYSRGYELKNFFEPEDFTLAELGINENDLFKKITKIKRDAVFTHSSVTNLGAVEYIGGSLSLYKSSVSCLGNLKYIGKNLNFKDSPLTHTGKLQMVNGIPIAGNIPVDDLPAMLHVSNK